MSSAARPGIILYMQDAGVADVDIIESEQAVDNLQNSACSSYDAIYVITVV